MTALLPRLLGAEFGALPAPVRAAHLAGDRLVLSGRCEVLPGPGLLPGLVRRLFGLPGRAGPCAITVEKRRDGAAELWERRFGAHVFRTRLEAGPDGLVETVGRLRFAIGLRVRDGGLDWPVTGARLGKLPLPRALWPVSTSRESACDGRFAFDIRLGMPLGGRDIVRYRGWLVPDVQGG